MALGCLALAQIFALIKKVHNTHDPDEIICITVIRENNLHNVTQSKNLDQNHLLKLDKSVLIQLLKQTNSNSFLRLHKKRARSNLRSNFA